MLIYLSRKGHNHVTYHIRNDSTKERRRKRTERTKITLQVAYLISKRFLKGNGTLTCGGNSVEIVFIVFIPCICLKNKRKKKKEKKNAPKYFLLQRTPFKMGFVCKKAKVWSQYSRLSSSRFPMDSLKYFKITVPLHIRFAELRTK